VRLDVFTPSIPFYAEALRTRVRVEMPGAAPTWILSAEALAVFKLLFFRPKDVLDLEKLVAVQGERLDGTYVRELIVEMLGADDERVARWDQLLTDARRRPRTDSTDPALELYSARNDSREPQGRVTQCR
jgi:hypothetical protein